MIPKIFSSSINPENLALTVKGILVGIIPLVLIISNAEHWNLGQEELTIAVDAIVNLIVLIGSAISALMILLGVVRKILVAVGLVKPLDKVL